MSVPEEQSVASLKGHYRSGLDALDADFFQPCLSHSERYDRAVAYFTSHALVTWARSVPSMFSELGVRIRLVIGPFLSDDDRIALERLASAEAGEGAKVADRIAGALLQETVDRLVAGADDARNVLFFQLLATRQLELKFAFPTHIEDAGIYHEKFGIFYLYDGYEVAFTGSANETAGGHRRNFEQVDVFRSWVDGDKARVEGKKALFAETWAGNSDGLLVVEPSTEILSRVKALARVGGHNDLAPAPLNKWRHQDEAMAAFLATPDRRGLLEMATGTGKTRTSLKVATNLLESGEIHGLVIATKGNDLLRQWYEEVLGWPEAAGLAVYRHFDSMHEIPDFALNPRGSILICSREALRQLKLCLHNVDKRQLLMVHDEAHGLGSPAMQSSLQGFHAEFAAVLGLSATPEREYDADGNAFILSEIGPTVYEFGLSEAIRRGILSPFDYIPLSYSLTDGDRQRLRGVAGRRAAAQKAGRPWSEEEFAREISRVYKTAELKPLVFSDFIAARADLLRASLVFVETTDFADGFVNGIARRSSSYSTYFETDPPERLAELARGELDCLVCCKRLSEGVDVRTLRNVFLGSADKGRLQTIQRIGRVLRTDPAEPEKVATVIDFVLDDPTGRHADVARSEWLTDLSEVRPEGGS